MQQRRWAPVTVFLILLCTGALPAAGEVLSPRSSAMGGTHLALADDLDTLFANPAGFRSAVPEATYFGLTFGLSGPLFDLAGLVAEGMSSVPVETLLNRPDVQDLMKSLYAAIHLMGPVSFGYVGNGWGLGAFNRTGFSFDARGTVPTVTASLEEELMLAGGYTFRLPLPESAGSTLDFGILVKTFARSRFSISRDLLGFFSALSDPGALLSGEPFRLTLGFGADMGLLYTWRRWLAVGLTLQDHPTVALNYDYASLQGLLDGAPPAFSFGLLPVNVTTGVTIRPLAGRSNRFFRDLSLSLDYHDALDFLIQPESATNPILHVGVGGEVVLMEVLALRAGFYQGLLNAGMGLDLNWLKFNLAVFGSELSSEPGLRPVFNLLMGLEIRHGLDEGKGRG